MTLNCFVVNGSFGYKTLVGIAVNMQGISLQMNKVHHRIRFILSKIFVSKESPEADQFVELASEQLLVFSWFMMDDE